MAQVAVTIACGVINQLKFSWPRFCFPGRFENKKTLHHHTAGLRGCAEGNSPHRASTSETTFGWVLIWAFSQGLAPPVPHSCVFLGVRSWCIHHSCVREHFLELFCSTLAPFDQTDNFGRSHSDREPGSQAHLPWSECFIHTHG